MKPQVEKEHYAFASYATKPRWASYWHQLDEVMRLRPESVLEIGIGAGVFCAMARLFQVPVQTVDIDPALNPDVVASIEALPFADKSHDVVATFQTLEHLPYERLPGVARELARVARRHVVISLPEPKRLWRYLLHIPKYGDLELFVPRPSLRKREHVFDGEHHWEIDEDRHSVNAIRELFAGQGLRLLKTYRVPEHTYHRFFVFSCADEAGRPDPMRRRPLPTRHA